jgi:RND family efflux transporter MFP subunit
VKNNQLPNVLFLTSTLLLLLLISACSGGGSPQQAPGGPGGPGGFVRSTTVEVRDVQLGEISDQIRTYGTVRAQDNVRVTPQVSERVVRILSDLGDTVRVGQVLARLNDTSFRDQMLRDRAQLDQARVALERDSLNFGRQQELFTLNLLSQAELDNARTIFFSSRAAYRSATAAYTQSSQNLSYTEIKSPVSGVVTRRLISQGDVAGAGQTSFEISNLAGYEVRAFLPLGDWRKARVGQSVEFRVSGAAENSATGVIVRVSPELDPITGLGEVVMAVSRRGPDLYPGVLVDSRINVQTKTGAVIIPRSAMVENVQTVIDPESNVIRLSRSYSVFVSQGDTVASRRALELGIQQGDRIEILDGLASGEKLIITGQNSLEDGSRIRVSGAPRVNPNRPQAGN